MEPPQQPAHRRAGNLYLIPTPLGNIDPHPTTTHGLSSILQSLRLFVAEKPKTASRYLSRMGLPLSECTFVPTGHLTDGDTVRELIADLEEGTDIGVLSEAGCPGVADPGSTITRAAHSAGIRVVPLVGPSSILLSLMASGLNGQSFTFHGYLPVDRGRRIRALRQLDDRIARSGETQIFIEAPHRNDRLFHDLLESCRAESELCIALDLTLPGELIVTRSIAQWRRQRLEIGKRAAIFLLGRS